MVILINGQTHMVKHQHSFAHSKIIIYAFAKECLTFQPCCHNVSANVLANNYILDMVHSLSLSPKYVKYFFSEEPVYSLVWLGYIFFNFFT